MRFTKVGLILGAAPLFSVPARAETAESCAGVAGLHQEMAFERVAGVTRGEEEQRLIDPLGPFRNKAYIPKDLAHLREVINYIWDHSEATPHMVWANTFDLCMAGRTFKLN